MKVALVFWWTLLLPLHVQAQTAALPVPEPVADPAPVARAVPLFAPDNYTLVGDRHFLRDYPAVRADGSINVVVEIPAGSGEKWEVDKEDGSLRWEFKNGAPRVVRYLGYPGNYGMVPRTLSPKELGGDGDALDVLALGPATSRGAVIRAKVIGVLRLLDDGEQDDKLLAVQAGSALSDVTSLEELRRRYPGVLTILETWFVNYKGPGRIESRGFADRITAGEILQAASKAFEAEQ